MFNFRDKARPVNTLVVSCGHMNAILSGEGVFPHANNIALQAESSNAAARVVGIVVVNGGDRNTPLPLSIKPNEATTHQHKNLTKPSHLGCVAL